MKAIRIHAYGDASQIKLEDAQRPQLKDNEVLVQIHDAGVNPVDWKIREGLRKSKSAFPLTLGQDFAGEVMDVGSNVRVFQVGDKVLGVAPGAYAEFAAVPADHIALIPSDMDFKTAAGLPTPAMTAWQAVIDLGQIRKGQKVLVHGAGGSVGSLAMQLAIWRGGQVFVTAGSEDIGYLRDFKVSQIIDYKSQKFEELVKDIDLVIDVIGGETLKKSLSVLKDGGRLITTVGPIPEKETREKNITAIHFSMKSDGNQLGQLADLVTQGVLELRLGETYPLAKASQAQESVKKGHTHGKVILHVT